MTAISSTSDVVAPRLSHREIGNYDLLTRPPFDALREQS